MPSPAWAVSRERLDAMLLERAAEAGAQVLQPASVRSVEYGAQRVVVRLADRRDLDGSLVIHADGSGRHDPVGPTPSRPGVTAHKCHLRCEPGQLRGVRMRACAGAYVGTIAVEDGQATCALVADSRRVAAHRGDLDALLGVLWPAYNPARRTSPWKSCGVGASGYRAPGHRRSLRIGNAAAAVEPVGGEGIGLALWSGALAANLLTAGRFDDRSFERVQAELGRDYRRRLSTRRWACRTAAAALVRPRLVRALWPLLALPDLTIRPWYALSGKRHSDA
jgi:menaquinone-9 beta-reductase